MEGMSEAELAMFRRFTIGGKVPRPAPGPEWDAMMALAERMLIYPHKGDMVLTHLGEAERAKLGA